MSSKTISFIMVTTSLGFTAYAFTRAPAPEPAPVESVTPQHGYVHTLARARNGSTQRSIAQAPPPMTGGGMGGAGGTGLGTGGGTGSTFGVGGGTGTSTGFGGGGGSTTSPYYDPNGTGTGTGSTGGGLDAGTGAGTTGDQTLMPH